MQTAKVIAIAEPVTKHRAQGGGQPKVGDIVEMSSFHKEQGVWWCRAVELNEYGGRLYGANFLPEQLEILPTLPAPDNGILAAPEILSTLEGDSTAEHEPTPAPCG